MEILLYNAMCSHNFFQLDKSMYEGQYLSIFNITHLLTGFKDNMRFVRKNCCLRPLVWSVFYQNCDVERVHLM